MDATITGMQYFFRRYDDDLVIRPVTAGNRYGSPILTRLPSLRLNPAALVSLDPTPDFTRVAAARRAWTARVDAHRGTGRGAGRRSATSRQNEPRHW